jgi:protein phosphatase 1 regulatory subunit 7
MNDQKNEPSLAEINQEKQNKIEKQIIYYPQSEQIDLSTYDEDTENIDMSLSRLTCIENFSKFKNLQSICFRSNLLKTLVTNNLLPENGLLHINELDFYDNQIEKIENLNQLVTLESLDLSFNRLNKIENLDMLVNLKKLFLVHNHFTKIENLENLIKLELLELGDNQLRTIENLTTFTNLQQL